MRLRSERVHRGTWKLVEEVKPKRIVLCYDNDAAGNAAAAKLAAELIARGITVVRAKLPPGKDINDVACMNKDARVALAIALETSAEEPGMDGPAASSRPRPLPTKHFKKKWTPLAATRSLRGGARGGPVAPRSPPKTARRG